MIAATGANATPIITGRRMPTCQKPTDWMRVTIPQQKRSALMSRAT